MDYAKGRLKEIQFFVGLHQPSDAKHFNRACISINRLRHRKKPLGFSVDFDLLLDSGAFTEISKYGGYRTSPAEYAEEIRRIRHLLPEKTTAVAQDYMCESFIIRKTGLSVREHQRLTIERYDALLAANPPVPILPVTQGFAPEDYRQHIEMYGDRLAQGAWAGVGSVCKRNGSPKAVIAVLSAIKSVRPDLKLHGFGLKKTALSDKTIIDLLYSADSMAWSFNARYLGRDQNDWREAARFVEEINNAIFDAQYERFWSN